MRGPRSHHVVLTSVAGLLVLVWYITASGGPHSTWVATATTSKLTLNFLRHANEQAALGLGSSIKYSRKCIRPVFSNRARRKEVTRLPGSLTDSAVILNLDQTIAPTNDKILTCTPIELTVPVPYPVRQYSDLIFGMATLYERMRDSLSQIKHWAHGSKIIAIIGDWEKQSKEDIGTLERLYRENGIQVKLIPPFDNSHSISQSHFMVLVQMVQESDDKTKWFGLLDDDTFFPHLGPLSSALGKLDHLADMYVGGLAEDFGSITNFGLMAYGGGGAFLSLSLAKKLGSLHQAEECIQKSPPDLGDIILRDCVYHYSKAKLTVLPGLYQHDLLNDLRGFYESGVEVLSLHHWKSWYHEPVVDMAAAAKYCGNCFLQRWTFGDNTVFSNGYSISIYRDGLEDIDLGKMEHTWGNVYGDKKPEYDFTIGPLRKSVGDERRKTFWLKRSEIDGGVMRQLYLHKGDPESGKLDEVIELIWIK